MKCPRCKEGKLDRDYVDIGIGSEPMGPWFCPDCLWWDHSTMKHVVVGHYDGTNTPIAQPVRSIVLTEEELQMTSAKKLHVFRNDDVCYILVRPWEADIILEEAS